MAQQSPSDIIWSQSLERKKHEVKSLLETQAQKQKKKQKSNSSTQVALLTLDEAITKKDLPSFQAAVEDLAKQFAHRQLSQLLTQHIYPHLDHVRSFHNGISSATQYESNAALAWGILLIAIQCGCIFAEHIEEIISQLGTLTRNLPFMQKDISHYPNSKALQFCLSKIFECYIDFCLIIIRHVLRSPFAALWKNLVSSSLTRTLKKTKDRLSAEMQDFNRAVDAAERDRAIQADNAIMSQLSSRNANTAQAQTPVQYPLQRLSNDQNMNFTGREADIQQLLTWIKDHKQARPMSCTIYGIPGMGKTELATELAYRCQSLFDVLIWVPADAEQETETLREFGSIGRELKLFENAEVSDSQVEKVLSWLQNEDRRWMIIFDNAEQWKHIKRYWPRRSRKPSVVILTSVKATPWVDHQHSLEPLEEDAGAQFLLTQMHNPQLLGSKEAMTAAKEISRELGGSPLFLTHAQGFMALSGDTLEGYLTTIRAGGTTLNVSSPSIWRYGKAASTTHDKILEKLSADAASLLFMFAFMAPDNIDEDLFLNLTDPSLAFVKNWSRYKSIIAELADSQLVRRAPLGTGHRLRIHRATQAALLTKLEKEPKERDIHFQRVTRLLRENFSESSAMMKLMIAEAHVWPRITRVLPHLMASFNYFERSWPGMQGDLFYAELLSDIASMDLYDRGRIAETYRFNIMIEKILSRLGYPRKSPLVATVLTMIGLCSDFLALSKRHDALKVRKECVQIREHWYGQLDPANITVEDKITLHNSYTDLVCSYQQNNEFDEARKYLEKCFVEYKGWGTEDKIPYEYAKYYNQLAYVLLHENKSDEAVQFAKRGFELVEKATPGAQIVGLYKSDYANILFQHGQQDEALQILRLLLKECKQECGKDNVRTLDIRLNVGIMCYFMGKYSDAKKQIEKALEMNNRDLWPEENTVRAKYYLSQTLTKINPPDPAAAGHAKEAKDGLDRFLAADPSGKAQELGNDLPMLYDYLVHWECRLVTPRKKIVP